MSDPPADRWFVLEHRPGPALPDGASIFATEEFGLHVAFLRSLQARGLLVAAGPLPDVDGAGMTVVRVRPEHGDLDIHAMARTEDRCVAGGPDRGWSDPLTIGAFSLSALSLTSFVLWELRNPEPMLDVRLFALRGFGTGSLALAAQFFGSFGLFFIVLQYLQYVAGLSPLQSALALLPLPVVLIPLARTAPRIADRFGINRVVALGLTLSAAGMLVLTTLDVDFVYWHLGLGLALFAAGMGLAGTPSTTAIVSSLPQSKQGVASAVNDTSRELGSALGIAILGTILSSGYRTGLAGALAGLPTAIADRVESSVSFVALGADELEKFGPAGATLVAAAKQSFVDATRAAFLTAACVLLVAAAYVAVHAPRRDEVPSGEAMSAMNEGAGSR